MRWRPHTGLVDVLFVRCVSGERFGVVCARFPIRRCDLNAAVGAAVAGGRRASISWLPLIPGAPSNRGRWSWWLKHFPSPPNPKKDLMFKSVTPEERWQRAPPHYIGLHAHYRRRFKWCGKINVIASEAHLHNFLSVKTDMARRGKAGDVPKGTKGWDLAAHENDRVTSIILD